MILSNLTRPISLAEQVVEKISLVNGLIDKLVSCFTRLDFNKEKSNLDYLGKTFKLLKSVQFFQNT